MCTASDSAVYPQLRSMRGADNELLHAWGHVRGRDVYYARWRSDMSSCACLALLKHRAAAFLGILLAVHQRGTQ